MARRRRFLWRSRFVNRPEVGENASCRTFLLPVSTLVEIVILFLYLFVLRPAVGGQGVTIAPRGGGAGPGVLSSADAPTECGLVTGENFLLYILLTRCDGRGLWSAANTPSL